MNKFKIVLMILSIVLFGIKQCENKQKQRSNELLKDIPLKDLQKILDNPKLYIKDIKSKSTKKDE
ncbi:hypothetical protein [Gilliamella sp. Pas-s95]|uniref:hypothetical protein n=1 Tax=Gilliamella sp. Pas-s95 TaxID=2687317 RepID=UPI0013235EB5|nr:hypothetical protein [Gilliamella sp. Pas-s95]MWN05033.1 hypothetical protein [Gilliamella sp. Pas-s95]